MSFVENLCFENFANSFEKTVIEVIFLMEVLSSVPTPMPRPIGNLYSCTIRPLASFERVLRLHGHKFNKGIEF